MNKKLSYLVIILILMVVIASCATTEKQSKVLGVEGVRKPSWVDKTPTGEELYFETGYAKLANKANSIKRANAEGKEKISQWISTTVENVVTNFTSDIGDETDRTAIESYVSISKQTSNTALVGVTQEEIWVDEDGGVWVLLSIPKDSVSKAFEKLDADFKKASESVHAKYKMEEALSMLEEQLASF